MNCIRSGGIGDGQGPVNGMSDRPRFLSPIVLRLSARSATHDTLSFRKPVDGHQDKNQQEGGSVGKSEEIEARELYPLEDVTSMLFYGLVRNLSWVSVLAYGRGLNIF